MMCCTPRFRSASAEGIVCGIVEMPSCTNARELSDKETQSEGVLDPEDNARQSRNLLVVDVTPITTLFWKEREAIDISLRLLEGP